MATVKSTKTSKTAAKDPAQETAPTNTDHDQTIPPAEDTAAEGSTPEPAASPAHQPSVDSPAPTDKGDSDHQEVGEHPGTILTAARLGLSPLQHVTAIIAGGVVGGMLARTKPYETLDLRKAAETIGMCAQLAEMILHLDDPMPEAPDNTEGI